MTNIKITKDTDKTGEEYIMLDCNGWLKAISDYDDMDVREVIEAYKDLYEFLNDAIEADKSNGIS